MSSPGRRMQRVKILWPQYEKNLGADMKRNGTKSKAKPDEPSLRDKLSANFLAAFEADFAAEGVAAIKALREKSPEKYSEIAARLIAAAAEQQPTNEWAACKSSQDIGLKLLENVGADPTAVTAEQIDQALAAQDVFMSALSEIAAQKH